MNRHNSDMAIFNMDEYPLLDTRSEITRHRSWFPDGKPIYIAEIRDVVGRDCRMRSILIDYITL